MNPQEALISPLDMLRGADMSLGMIVKLEHPIPIQYSGKIMVYPHSAPPLLAQEKEVAENEKTWFLTNTFFSGRLSSMDRFPIDLIRNLLESFLAPISVDLARE